MGSVGLSRWLDQQLDPESLADPVGDRIRSIYPEMGRDIAGTRAAQEEFGWDSMFAVGQATLALSIWSTRQLFEVMVEFWNNHLNVTCPSDGVWDNRADYDRTVIRANALGKFSDMLAASAVHPAMLNFLDNRSSTKAHPNENYGRELLELHTVGIGAYGEDEVLASARIMTGWTIDNSSNLAIYRSNRHWTGRVVVLGFSHANSSADGRQVVRDYLDYLSHHELTAQRVCRKLCQRFVSDAPSEDLVASLADTYLANDTAIKPVLRELFSSDEFWSARGKKVRRPMEDITATVRTLGHSLLPTSQSVESVRRGIEALYWMTNDLQHAPLAWSLPTGYPDVAAEWASADLVLGRINAHRSLAEGWWPNQGKLTIVKPQTLLPNPMSSTYGNLIDAMAIRLVGDKLSNASRVAIANFFGKTVTSPIAADDEVRNWRAGTLVTLILNSAAHGVR